jgi:hypothetical protein
MLDVDTFLTTLYVIVDDFCHSRPPKRRPGPKASLSSSEVLTLAIFARWSRFDSERDFYRYADTKLRDAFPTLPERSQFNRSVRSHVDLIEAFVLHLVTLLQAPKCLTKPWTAQRCPSGTPSAGDMDGSQDKPTSAGLIA